MKRVALVGAAGFAPTEDDRLLLEPLLGAGIEPSVVLWDDPAVEWPAFDAVVVRSTWDYYTRGEEWRGWIEARASDGSNLWNPPEVLRWNVDKRYLQQLEAAGLSVVHTAWLRRGGSHDLRDVLHDNGWARAVIKSAYSAGGYRTWVVESEDAETKQPLLDELLADEDVMVQPFLEEVVTEGEWSFVFLGGRYSHAALKRPQGGDFRVQPSYGGTFAAVEAPGALVAHAGRFVDAIPGDTLYARVDAIRDGERLVLVELEAMEPSLFFSEDPRSPARFVQALLHRLRE